MTNLCFGRVDRLVIFGGGRLLAALVSEFGKFPFDVTVVSSPRHLEERIASDGETLWHVLEGSGVPVLAVENVNDDPRVLSYLTPTTFGLAVGPAWIFRQPVLEPLRPRLVNFHGIRLPQYRGGAHYSWQILRRNRIGGCNIQLIEPALDAGAVVKSREYFFPVSARIPRDYFDAAIQEERYFITEFLGEVHQELTFSLRTLQESFGTYFPRLNTLKHGLIDWSWGTTDIEIFVCAFDEPYQGASTYLDGRRVFLKDCSVEFGDGPFHPFQVGTIYRKTADAVFVATRDGALVVRSVTDESGAAVMAQLKVGQRLCTRRVELDAALSFRAVYDSKGLKT